MIQFIKGSELSQSLEEMIENADKFLWLISPYIKLSGRIKDVLKPLKRKDAVQITIVYGKNETDKSKSLSKDDFDFLKEFPYIKICYEKNLHAKYYASEDFSLLCSMNLHEFSQNTNIEAGVRLTPKDIITGVISSTLTNSEPEINAQKYFTDIIENSEIEFYKKSEYKKNLLGLSSSYIGSTVLIDKTENKGTNSNYNKPSSTESYNNPNSFSTPSKGFCIRTGVPIPFNLEKPLSYDAFKTWSQFKNPDYPEKFCHATGKESYGKTTVRNPVLKS